MTNDTVVIEASRISKCFKLYSSPRGRLTEWLSAGRAIRHHNFWALKDVNVTLYKGECLGIIGANGSGKSTLLKILSGSLSPTEGTVRTMGDIYALIELSTGFNRQLTGRQNIEFVAEMLGLAPEYIQQRTNDIIEFAELGEYIDQPCRYYSSGMFARLGFSLFAFLEPDVLMIDEVLAVGDASFKQKCFGRIEELVQAEQRAAVFVAHSMPAIARLCNRVIWLDNGSVRMNGDAIEIVSEFLDFYKENRAFQKDKGATADDLGLTQRQLTKIPVCNHLRAVAETSNGETFQHIGTWIENVSQSVIPSAWAGTPFFLCFAFRATCPLEHISANMQVVSENGRVVAEKQSEKFTAGEHSIDDSASIIVRWRTQRGLSSGRYVVRLLLTSPENAKNEMVFEGGFELSVVGKAFKSAPDKQFSEPIVTIARGSAKEPDN